MLKRIQVILLPTNKKANLVIILEGNNKGKLSTYDDLPDGENFIFHDLYFLSDEEIKEGDWVYRFNSKDIFKADDFLLHLIERGSTETCKKIICTTDDSLVIKGECKIRSGRLVETYRTEKHLPQPSEDFIKVFVEEYNKGNQIEWVDVEYDVYYKDGYGNWLFYDKEFWDKESYKPKFGTRDELKVNSNNEISIRKIKDTWTRDEVIALIKEFDNSIRTVREDEISYRNKWIENNL